MQIGVDDDDSQLCQWGGCTEIDLLPARCSNCTKTFCSQHISSGAHQCPAWKDSKVLECPLCTRVVPLEYPDQRADEAVSRHMDRGCRDVPKAAPPSQRLPSGGYRLGGSSSPPPALCSVSGCTPTNHVRVQCERCARTYCVHHRDPASHQCRVERRQGTVNTPPPVRGGSTPSPPPQGSTGPVSVSQVLRGAVNTKSTAFGKATENPTDMVTPLISILLPATTNPNGGGSHVEPIASFFMHVAKNIATGRMLDLAVDEASKRNSSIRGGAARAWKTYVIPLPLPGDAPPAAAYPEVPLSTLVRNTPLGTSGQCVVVISALGELPPAVLEALKDMKVNHQSDDKCVVM